MARAGRYEIKLRERPPQADYPIDGARARVRIGGQEAEKAIAANAQEVAFEIELAAGDARLETWLEKPDGTSKGAWFAYVNRLS